MDEDKLREQNRRAWNSISDRRDDVRGMPAAPFFAAGGSTLDDVEVEALGDVEGQTLLHLGCASGGDTLSWAIRGAVATGVDISDVAIDLARQKAAAASLPTARFVRADILDLPAELQARAFDIVYVKAGVLCWMSDISRWAQVVVNALRRGGRALVYEMHPLVLAIDVVDGAIVSEWSYFGRGPELVEDPTMTGVPTSERRYQFTWPLGDVVTALIDAGLTIDRLSEFPGKEPPLDKLPASFLLLAHKP